MLLAVAGCVAQAEGEEIVARAPVVDLVVGPQSYHRLPEMIARTARAGGHALETDFPALEKFDSLTPPQSSGVSAFLTVQEGCDKFCTFCVVPYTRGSEHSRPPQAILREARQLADKGAREIVLLGQNVNAYRGADGWSLARLCEAIADIESIARIRYTTSHPRDMGDDLIAAHGGNQKLMPYLHLPVQSGSDAVLEAMNRQHSADDYRRLIERIRAVRPDIALTSDFIVGFPGESDADFEATLKLVRDIGYATAFSFKYSKRPGTPASTMRKQIPEDVKAARLDVLQKLLLSQQYAFDDSKIGKVLPVLFEKAGPRRRPDHGPHALSAAGACPGRCRPDRHHRRCEDRAAHRQQPAWRLPGRGLSAKKNALTLEFPDNRLLAALGGPHAKHFARIEQKLNVGIDMRGNLVAIEGKDRERAGAILRALYSRLEAGESVTLAEVDAEIRFTDEARSQAPGAIKTASSRAVRPRSPAQAAYLEMMRQCPLVFGIGPAGTGKTYLAAAFAAHMLHEKRVERLILSRPALEAGERLGFLPGDLKEKIDPYLRPLYDALFDVLGDRPRG